MSSATTASVSPATLIQKEAAADWDIWESSNHTFDTPSTAPGLGKFFFDYADNYEERVVVLEGSALLHPSDGGDAISLNAGDAVSFPQGFSCTWEVLEPMRKQYAYFDREGNKTVSNAIACDGEGCGVDCWEESYFLEEGGLDLCVSCYEKRGLTGGEYQREGTAAEVLPPSKKKQKTRA